MTLHPVAPGVGATFYGNLPRDLETAQGREVIASCDHVTLHTAADAGDVRNAGVVRRSGCQRVWLAIPANYLSRIGLARGLPAAVAEAQRCARVARDAGVEVFELNGEGASDGKVEGDWTSAPGDAREARRLGELAVAVLEAARDVLQERAAIAFTSHDMPGFRLPWAEILSRVDLHSPQHYPAQAGRLVPQRELDARVARSLGRWEALVERGEVAADVIPYGPRWSPYFQGHGHQLGALVWALCEAPTARLWASPGSWSDDAPRALRLARRIRAEVGLGPGTIERFQFARGLAQDGAVGPKTLAALGVA